MQNRIALENGRVFSWRRSPECFYVYIFTKDIGVLWSYYCEDTDELQPGSDFEQKLLEQAKIAVDFDVDFDILGETWSLVYDIDESLYCLYDPSEILIESEDKQKVIDYAITLLEQEIVPYDQAIGLMMDRSDRWEDR